MELFNPCDALHNMRIGGPYETEMLYAFKVPREVKCNAVQLYLLADPVKAPNYAGGDGGRIEIALFGSKVEGSTCVTPFSLKACEKFSFSRQQEAKLLGYFPLIDFLKDVTLIPDRVYYLRFQNTHDKPVDNYFSVNFMHVSTPGLFTRSPYDSCVQWNYPESSEWKRFKSGNACQPIFSLMSSKTNIPGVGYSGAETSMFSEQRLIGGPHKVIQSIQFKNREVNCNCIGLRLATYPDAPSLPSNLLLTIYEKGNLNPIYLSSVYSYIVQGQFFKDSLTGHDYCLFHLGENLTFFRDVEYRLEFSGNKTATVKTFAVRDGSVYGFESPLEKCYAGYLGADKVEHVFMEGKWGTDPRSFLPLLFLH